MGHVARDALRRLARNAAALAAFAALGYGLLFGLSLAYRNAYPPIAASWGGADRPGSVTWVFYVIVGVLGVFLRAVVGVADARSALSERRFGATLADAIGWTAGALPQIALACLALDLPQLLYLAAPVQGRTPNSLVPWVGLVDIAAVALFIIVGPVRGVFAAERLGPFQTIGRSVRLVSSHRWSFLGLCVIFLPLASAPAALVFVALPVLGRTVYAAVRAYADPLLNQLTLAVLATANAAAYVELVRIKEGRDSIAAVFD